MTFANRWTFRRPKSIESARDPAQNFKGSQNLRGIPRKFIFRFFCIFAQIYKNLQPYLSEGLWGPNLAREGVIFGLWVLSYCRLFVQKSIYREMSSLLENCKTSKFYFFQFRDTLEQVNNSNFLCAGPTAKKWAFSSGNPPYFLFFVPRNHSRAMKCPVRPAEVNPICAGSRATRKTQRIEKKSKKWNSRAA